VRDFDYFDAGYLIRIFTFSAGSIGVIAVMTVIRYKFEKKRTVMMALTGGTCQGMVQAWLPPFLGMIYRFGNPSGLEVGFFFVSGIILGIYGIVGTITIQKAFQTGDGSIVIPLRMVPLQLIPILLFLIVYQVEPPRTYSVWFLAFAGLFIVIGAAILGNKQGSMKDLLEGEETEATSKLEIPKEKEEIVIEEIDQRKLKRSTQTI
jgi:hypothetical protein